MNIPVTIESVALAIASAVLWWLAKQVIEVRDKQRDLNATIYGVNGVNGLQRTLDEMKTTMKVIKDNLQHCQVSHGIIADLPVNRGEPYPLD